MFFRFVNMATGSGRSCVNVNSAKRKRKISDEGREFNDDWTRKYLFILFNKKPLCLVCGDNVAVLKEYNLKRHYETKHEPDYSKYEDKLRDDKIEELKLMLNKQQTLFYKVNKESETAVRASYVITEEIAKKRKPFSDGEFIKDCMMRAAEIVCPDKKQCFLNISLSRNTCQTNYKFI